MDAKKGVAHLLSGNIIGRAITFALNIGLSRTLGPVSLGLFGFCLAAAQAFELIARFGIDYGMQCALTSKEITERANNQSADISKSAMNSVDLITVILSAGLLIWIFPFQGLSALSSQKDFYNKQNLEKIDAILVLGGDERRIIYAINTLKKHKDAKLIFSGGSGFLIPNQKFDENKLFQNLTKNILKPEDFFTLKSSRNTIENLINFKEFNNNNKFEKVVVLTSPAHMKRTLIISEKLNLNLYPHYWNKEKKEFSIINNFQKFSFVKNLRSFDNLFRETIGILILKFINFEN